MRYLRTTAGLLWVVALLCTACAPSAAGSGTGSDLPLEVVIDNRRGERFMVRIGDHRRVGWAEPLRRTFLRAPRVGIEDRGVMVCLFDQTLTRSICLNNYLQVPRSARIIQITVLGAPRRRTGVPCEVTAVVLAAEQKVLSAQQCS
jgi:hypothetical protein